MFEASGEGEKNTGVVLWIKINLGRVENVFGVKANLRG